MAVVYSEKSECLSVEVMGWKRIFSDVHQMEVSERCMSARKSAVQPHYGVLDYYSFASAWWKRNPNWLCQESAFQEQTLFASSEKVEA